MRGARVAAVLLAAALLGPDTSLAGPLHVEDTFARYFRVEWAATPAAHGPEITGYVENVGNVPVDRMRVVVERLDASGAVIGSSTTWVMGVVIPRHRSYFTTRVAPAAAYRVGILTFEWSNCRD